jgi:benzoylsuccinyl-CoA thiolase BbsA subunit
VSNIAVNAEAASADPRFVAPNLVRVDASGKPHLVGGRCSKCDAFSFPRAAVCTSCLSEEIAAVDLADEGALYSYSIVHQAPKGWATPYALGYVDLPGDVRVLAHIDVPHEKIAIDMKLRLAIGVVGSDPSGAPLMSYTFTGR